MWTAAAIFFGLALLFPFTLGFAAAIWEKRMVWPYAPAQPAEAMPPPGTMPVPAAYDGSGPVPATAHISGTNYTAWQRGFRSLGVMRSVQGKLYKIRYDYWLSPDCLVLVSVSGGTLASISVENTTFYTLLANGKRLITIRNAKASESDLTGLIEEVLVPDAPFDRELEKHWQRVATSGVQAVPFNPDDPLSDLHRMMTERIDRMVRMGYATYVDPAHAWWKYNVKGAAILTAKMVLRGWRRSILPDRTRRA